MIRIFLLLCLCTVNWVTHAAESITPTISPAFFQHNTSITVTYDVTGTPMAGLTVAYIWVWIPGSNINAKFNINPASANSTLTNVDGPNGPKCTKSVVLGRTYFTITFVPSNFFTGSITSATSMGILLKGNDWPNGQTTDFVTSFWDGSFSVMLSSPANFPVFVDQNDNINVHATTPVTANFELFINNVSVNTSANATAYNYNHTVTESSGYAEVKLVATSTINAATDEIEFQYIISANSPTVTRPAGIKAGINYNSGDATKATLCLWAPLKTSVYAVGDFNDWTVTTDFLMNKHGEYFWIELTGLTPGIEYAFRYLVDESIHVADPFADKILDPDDQYISSSTYPSLKPFPTKALRNQGYENRVSVLQTNQTPYAWQTTFVKPPKENLVIYELLIRDFFDDDHRNYQALIDTIAYFKRLGINAIELMPIMEFNGNEGWGYNPTFMFAPDKYYGTKNKLKEFIDTCHANDIAVILDIAMNHQDVPNPFALMYFEFGADGTFGKPAANNPWFNRNPRHPYNVFFDLNHSSTYTQAYLDTVTHYWLNEYRVDGYRFDLSKGFTQNNNCGGSQSDEGCFGNTDNSRITILRRMADKIWSHTSDAVIILEHFASNTEEKALAEYRAGEGKGMMLWGNLNYAYAQNTMGYTSGSDVNSVLHSSRNWTVPHLVGYMESHDEERVMYKNLTFGEEGENYSVLSENIALQRMTGAGLIFLTLPGPKMMWQFAELGYDKSINLCENGTNNSDCRLSPKPPGWIYQDVAARSALYSRTADMLRLRNEYGVFTTGTAAFAGSTTLQKQVTIRNSPYTSTPASTSEMNVHVVTNFDVVPKTVTASFPHAGSWFEYYTHSERLDITTTDVDMELLPGEYRLYTDVAIENPLVVGLEKSTPVSAVLYPNPVKNILMIEARTEVQEVALYNMMGMVFHPERINVSSWNVANLSAGMYIAEIRTATTTQRVKVVKD